MYSPNAETASLERVHPPDARLGKRAQRLLETHAGTGTEFDVLGTRSR
jgi:hypothetical protein